MTHLLSNCSVWNFVSEPRRAIEPRRTVSSNCFRPIEPRRLTISAATDAAPEPRRPPATPPIDPRRSTLSADDAAVVTTAAIRPFDPRRTALADVAVSGIRPYDPLRM